MIHSVVSRKVADEEVDAEAAGDYVLLFFPTGTDRVAFFLWLQTEHSNSKLSAVVAPPKENGIT